MKRTRWITSIAVALSLALAVPAGATPRPATPRPAAPGGGTVTGPTPQTYDPVNYPAGQVCAFPVRLTFPVNQVVGYFYADSSGRTVAAYYEGTLIMKVTRRDTGATVTKDISGRGVQTFATDGSSTLYGYGPFSVSLHPTDTPSRELTVLHGVSAVQLGADGHKTVLFSSRIENVCPELQ